MTKFLTPTLLLAFSLSALGQGYEITSGKKEKGESVKEWGAQEVVLVGELKKLSGGRVGQGSPPTFSYRLELTVKETLGGRSNRSLTCKKYKCIPYSFGRALSTT